MRKAPGSQSERSGHRRSDGLVRNARGPMKLRAEFDDGGAGAAVELTGEGEGNHFGMFGED